MGIVYLAYRLSDDLPVALKTIRPAVRATDAAVARFLREAAILKDLRHPNIVAFHDQGRSGDLLFFVMDYVTGVNAGNILEQHGSLPIGRAVRLISQLLDALDYAHGHGFIHRDVKPSNVLVTEANGTEVVRLADFGLARTYQASQLSGLTMTGTAAGTPAFMPPEQLSNFRRVQPAGDQYAAAATLYTLLTGRSVHGAAASPRELFQRILLDDPADVRAARPDVPAGLAAVLRRALARRPEDRFADVARFGQALQAFTSV